MRVQYMFTYLIDSRFNAAIELVIGQKLQSRADHLTDNLVFGGLNGGF